MSTLGNLTFHSATQFHDSSVSEAQWDKVKQVRNLDYVLSLTLGACARVSVASRSVCVCVCLSVTMLTATYLVCESKL